MEKYLTRKSVMRKLYADVCTRLFELTVINHISEDDEIVKDLRSIVTKLDKEFDFANE